MRANVNLDRLRAPPHKPVEWVVRRRDTGREVRVVVQTAYFALQRGAVALKDD